MVNDEALSHLIGRSFNGYRVTRYIARGGMGVVFEGVQESLDRPVALKFLYPHLSGDERFRERFDREARAIARLNHPHIARVLDYGQEDSYYFMVLDYIDGSNLRQPLVGVHSQGLTLRSDVIMSISQQIGSALSYAHSMGIVHRDIKPSNIMLGSNGHAYLTDFGVVKMIGSSQLTATGTFIGTPEYMSPEQASGSEIGPASDLYSLAVVAYEMLVGRVPFVAQTPIGLMHKQVNEIPALPSSVVPWSSPRIDATFARALAKEPSDRHSNIAEFVNDLAIALSTNWVSSGVDMAGLLSDAPTISDQRAAHPATPSPAPLPYQFQTPLSAGSTLPVERSTSSAQVPTGGVVSATPMHSGAQVPPGPPTVLHTRDEDEGSGHRRRTTVAATALVLLLLGAVGVYFLGFADDNSEGSRAASLDAPTATATADTIEATTPTVVSVAAVVPTPTVAVVPTEPEPTEIALGDSTATPAPLPTMVIYYAYKPQDEHNPQIYVMNLDGSGSRLFAEARGHSWGPVASPDGSRLIFSSVTREGHTIHTPDGGGLVGSGDHDVYVLDVVGDDLATLAPANLTNVTQPQPSWDNGWSWSVDGEWITLTSDREDASGTTDWEIYLMSPDGSEIRQLTDTPYNEGWPVWTPDGRQIVFASDESGSSQIHIMNADGTNRRQLSDRPRLANLYPSVSPDGSKIIFSSQVPDGSEGNIWIMDIDGSNERQLTNTAALNNIPSWCPAGDLIVYVSNIRGNDNIYIMNADGTGVTQLTQEPDQITPGAPENTTPHCTVLPGGNP